MLPGFWRVVGMIGLALWLGGCASQVDAPQACTADDLSVPWQAVLPDVWVWSPPAVAEVSVRNGGFVLPVTAVVDGTRALVIDPGPHRQHGLRVRSSLRCQFGADVTAVVNTHAHAENVLANAAFAGSAAIWALPATARAMANRCPDCLQSLTGHVGAGTMQNTAIALPTHELVPGQVLPWGRYRFEVLPAEQGHTDADLLLWLPAERWLWAGGLTYQGRVPELAQGSLEGWLSALERMVARRPVGVVGASVSVVVNGQGIPPALTDTQRYLKALKQRVWSALDSGASPHDTAGLTLPAFAHWVGYGNRHGFNAQRAWRELEPTWMEQGASVRVP
ncbi:MAG TPA: MBL fold metallo-hydrolase [Burkholderiaceae bacterium]|nr:MBL fold metallo-hydrolase [Burkholderiaceae bacterium]